MFNRWGVGSMSVLQFDSPVPPGDYILNYVGFRTPHPVDPAPMTFQFVGEARKHRRQQPAGEFHVRLPVRITKDHGSLALRVEHRVKRLSKRNKEELVHANPEIRGLFDLLALRPDTRGAQAAQDRTPPDMAGGPHRNRGR